ncbi:transmembrane protein, putative [Medicago truncatula]|uniref:Transmembrane protein, putative n=1 Tax=Medicago truncatula TaxID=3880 RepID=A0A072TPK3_MEDTR|nr:transmembrane protein, putative [Medicago truncatula]
MTFNLDNATNWEGRIMVFVLEGPAFHLYLPNLVLEFALLWKFWFGIGPAEAFL